MAKRKRILICLSIMTLVFTMAFSCMSIEAATALKAPTLKVSSKTASSITLKWDKVKNAKTYKVYQKVGTKYKVIKSTSTLKCYKKGLKANTLYQFYVKSVNKKGVLSKASKVLKVRTYLEAPVNLRVKSNTATSIKLAWNNYNKANYYKVYQRVDGKYTIVKTVTTRYATIGSLVPSQSYKFYVRGSNTKSGTAISGAKSLTITAKTKAEVIKLKASTSKTSVSLSWTKSGYAKAYNVYQDDVKIATVKENSYKVSGLKPSTSYEFYVEGTSDSAGEEAYIQSNAINAATQADIRVEKEYKIVNIGEEVNIQSEGLLGAENQSSDILDVAGSVVKGKAAGYGTVRASYEEGGNRYTRVYKFQVLGTEKVIIPFKGENKELVFGMSERELLNRFGQPTEVLYSYADYMQYVYADDYKSFFAAGVKQGKVINVYTQAKGFKFNIFECGMTKEELEAKGFKLKETEYLDGGHSGFDKSHTYSYNGYEVEPCLDFECSFAGSRKEAVGGWTKIYYDERLKNLFGIFIQPKGYDQKVCYPWEGKLWSVEKMEEGQSKLLFHIVNATRTRHKIMGMNNDSFQAAIEKSDTGEDLWPYKWSAFTYHVAYWKSRDMDKYNYFSHRDESIKEDRWINMNWDISIFRCLAEEISQWTSLSLKTSYNLAYCVKENLSGGPVSAWETNCGLYNSGGHRAAMLSYYGEFYESYFAPSVKKSSGGSKYLYYWTEIFSNGEGGLIEVYDEKLGGSMPDYAKLIDEKRKGILDGTFKSLSPIYIRQLPD